MGELMQKYLKMEAYKRRAAELEKQIYLDQAKEVDLLMREGLTYEVALRKVKSMYEKAQSLATKQGKEHNKTFNEIISETEDLDNGEVYDINTGQTIREL